MQARFWVERKH